MSERQNFMDVFESEDSGWTVSYRSGMLVYQESVAEGHYLSRGWNATGLINPPFERIKSEEYHNPQAFWLEIDGQLLHSHWKKSDYSTESTEQGLLVQITLEHEVRPIRVVVNTLLDGTSIIMRWLDIVNLSNQPAALSAAYPLSGILQTVSLTSDMPADVYDVGYFENTLWGNEGSFDWTPLTRIPVRIDGRYNRDKHRHPFFVLRNNKTGEHFIGQLAWSGGYSFEFDMGDKPVAEFDCPLVFRGGPTGPAPLRVIQPKETVTTPQLHMGMVIGDLDEAINEMHCHLRKSVLPAYPKGREQLLEYGVGPEQGSTFESALKDIDIAAELGFEVFFLDAGWYAPEGVEWYETMGDWEIDEGKYPDGLKPLADYVHNKGMLFGLWMEPERMVQGSNVFKEHPEYRLMKYRQTRCGHLDVCSDAINFMETKIDSLIGDQNLDFFRLDYNAGNMGAFGFSLQDGFVENGYWRYYEKWYGMWERLKRKYPNVILENCSSGGGRTDLGMMQLFHHTWISDWQIPPRSFKITSGMTMALPPERIDRLIGMGQSSQRAGELEFQLRTAILAKPTGAWLWMHGSQKNVPQLTKVKHAIDIYKNFVRTFNTNSRIYHHTPVLRGTEPQGWGVLELASEDRSKALAGLFRLGGSGESEYTLKFRGLDVSKQYQVTFDNSGSKCIVNGFDLKNKGVNVRLDTPLTSELLLLENI